MAGLTNDSDGRTLFSRSLLSRPMVRSHRASASTHWCSSKLWCFESAYIRPTLLTVRPAVQPDEQFGRGLGSSTSAAVTRTASGVVHHRRRLAAEAQVSETERRIADEADKRLRELGESGD